MRKQSETLLVLVLLPILVLGMVPMLLFGLLGFAGLGLLGVLVICVGLADGLSANSDFNQSVIVRGYAPRSERTMQASNLHSIIRFAVVMCATGIGLIIIALAGFCCFG